MKTFSEFIKISLDLLTMTFLPLSKDLAELI